MRKPIKVLLFLVGTPILLVILLVVGLLVFVDSAAKAGIQRGGTYAMGVDTSVSSVSIGLFSGKLSMSGLKIANPKGFTADRFMSMGQGDVAVSLSSLTKDTIVVPTLALDTIDVDLEKKGTSSNYQTILDNLQKLSGPSKPAQKPAEPGKKFIINDLTIRHVKVHADVLGLGGTAGKLSTVDVPIDEIKLTNVGQDTGSGMGGSGVTIGQLSSIIVQAVLAAAAEKGGDLLGPISGELKGAIAQIGDLKNLNVEVRKAGEVAQQIGGKVGKAAEQIQKQVEGATGEAQKQIDKLKGLIPGGDKPKK